MGCSKWRDDFPEIFERNVAFLDSAASTLKPVQVLDAMKDFTLRSYANVHRGVYKISLEASRAYEEAHEIVAKFISASSWEEVVFTKNTTEAIQLVAMLLLSNGYIKKGDEIIASKAEHHSNLLPWARVAEAAGAELKLVPVNREGVPRWELLGEVISKRTKVVAIAHASNVTGYISDVRKVAEIAHEQGALVVVDGAQSVPHIRTDVRELGIDFLAFSGHKMLGPSGIGVLWGRGELLDRLEPFLGGGGTVSRVSWENGKVKVGWSKSPWKFEAGTPPIMEAVGLTEAIRYLWRVGMGWIEEHERELTSYTVKKLSEVEGLRFIGPRDLSRKLGIVAFNVGKVDPSMVGLWLDQYGVAVRTGLHCAHILHDELGESHGSVRASFYLYTCKEDVDRLVLALHELTRGPTAATSSPI
ncbi:MAG: cysteine desulfurase [Acidilobaceae archaeon]|nr:cysteine desulfurase [Acidilobaceae archaeon]MCX8165581.1 cysteine desulfurase [Acidilobaceae archaeon]MDW7974008.1 cysteine desulfurase [Sulfolobales archaeon]